MATFFTFLTKRSKRFVVALALIVVLIIALIDYLTSTELSLSVFYLLPVFIAAWYADKWNAFLVSLFSAVTWFFVDFIDANIHAYAFIPYWNAAVRLGIFAIVTYILSRLKASVEYEFELAKEIQQGFLPRSTPEVEGVEIAGRTQPSHAVSGDYFDVLRYNEHEVGLCVADVVGHGIPAALLMSNLQAAVRIYASGKIAPRELCEKLNQTVCANIVPGKFITFFYALLDAKKRELTYTNAGHNPPILVRKDGSHELLDSSDIVFGVSRTARYRQSRVQLAEGDRLLLFTDGVTEVENRAGEQFGVQRLVELVRRHPGLSAAELERTILRRLSRFSKNTFRDDITLLLVVVKPEKEKLSSHQVTDSHGQKYGTPAVPDGTVAATRRVSSEMYAVLAHRIRKGGVCKMTKYLKLALISMLFGLVLIGCSRKNPVALGQNWEIYAVADESDWQQVGPILKEALEKKIPTPLAESEFVVEHILPEQLEDYGLMRNLILISSLQPESETTKLLHRVVKKEVYDKMASQEEYLFVARDQWAQGQLLVILAAPGEALKSSVASYPDFIYNLFNTHRNQRLQEVLFFQTQGRLERHFKSSYGWTLKIPFGYTIALEDTTNHLIQLSMHNPDRNIFVHWIDHARGLNINDAWLRDKVNWMASHYHGAHVNPGDYYLAWTTLDGQQALQMSGLWESDQELNGGPMRAYAIRDAKNDRVYVIFTNVFAPDRRKEPYLRQFEQIATTFKTFGLQREETS